MASIQNNILNLLEEDKKRGKKSAFIVTPDLSATGAPRALLEFCRVLIDNNISCYVFYNKYPQLDSEFRNAGITPFYIPGCYFLRKLESRLIQRFDFAVCNTLYAWRYVDIMEIHHVDYIWWIHEGSIGQKAKAALQNLQKNGYIYTVSQLAEKQLQPDIICTDILPPLQPDRFNLIKAKASNAKFTISVIGAIYHLKAQDIVIQAFEKLAPEIQKRCRIKFIGHANQFRKYVQSFFQSIKKHPELIFCGAMDSEKTLQEIADSDLCLIPSRLESFSLVALESLMCNVPVLISDNTGMASYITPCQEGWVFPSENSDALANYLTQIIQGEIQTPSGKPRALYETKLQLPIFVKKVEDILQKIKRKQ